MTKIEIDYSNTVFYKIYCKDPTIKDLYVGMTTNFVQRKHGHKQSCKNEKASNYNCKLYNYIRNAGGWENWQMEIIAFHNCKDSYEAHKKEQEYFEMLGATLNSMEPLPKPKEPIAKIVKEKPIMFCEACNVYFSHWKAQETHNNTNKHHKMVSMHKDNISEMTDSLVQHGSINFTCKSCYYTTSRDSQYKRHLLTRKHIETYERLIKSSIHISTDAEYTCVCGKSYNHRQSLHKHKQKCNPLGKENIINNMCHPTFSQSDNHMSEQADTISNLTNLVTTMMGELAKQSAEAERKNAIIEKLYNLSNLEVTKRPIHCTDVKRKSMYVKKDNEWKKDDKNEEVRKAINQVANKNIQNIEGWRVQNLNQTGNSVTGGTAKRQQYLAIVSETLEPDDDGKKSEKILKNVGEAVLLDKNVIELVAIDNDNLYK